MNLLALLITGLTLVGIIAFHFYRRTKEGSPARSKSGSQAMLERLSEESAVLNSSVDVLCELSEEYFISINSNGFADLCKINEALKATIEICAKMEIAKDIERRDELLRYVYIKRGKGVAPGFLFQRMNEDLIQSLEDWDERLATILLKITDGIHNSSSSFKKVERYRTTKRHNTTQMLKELVGMVRR